jgi:hypothetical protein
MTVDAEPARGRKSWLRSVAFVAIGLVIGVTGAAAVAAAVAPVYEKLPACVEEDGNTDGKACWWTDPDTGTRYYVTSENYLPDPVPSAD